MGFAFFGSLQVLAKGQKRKGGNVELLTFNRQPQRALWFPLSTQRITTQFSQRR